MRNANAVLAMHRARRRGGYSLMEIAMVLAIIALLVAGVMLFFSNASTANKTNDAMTEVANIQQVVRSLGAGQPDYTWMTDASLLASSKQLPSKWVKGTTLVNPFNAAVAVATASTNSAGDSFTVEFDGVPDQACTKMTTMDLGTSLLALKTGSGSTVNARAMTPTEATTACNGSNNNTITWTFN